MSGEKNPSGGTDDAAGILNAGNSWLDEGKDTPDGLGVLDFADAFSGVGQVLVIIGTISLLIVGGIMAIQWITATPEKQAKLKTQLIGLVVAAVVIFGAIGIWNFIRSIGNDVEEKLRASIVVIADK